MMKIILIKSGTIRMAATAGITLLLGIIYYWLARPLDSASFLALMPAPPLALTPAFFARWLGWLPTFVHVFAFSLLTWLTLGRRHVLFSCILWGVVNALFELGQALPVSLLQYLPESMNLRTYFSYGVFDPLDLSACVIGSWVAFVILRKFQNTLCRDARPNRDKQENEHHEL
jgi:hypothetical protein